MYLEVGFDMVPAYQATVTHLLGTVALYFGLFSLVDYLGPWRLFRIEAFSSLAELDEGTRIQETLMAAGKSHGLCFFLDSPKLNR